jgi:hypothetical protein
VGGFAGVLEECSVEKCFARGGALAKGGEEVAPYDGVGAGGFAAYVGGGNISNCYARGSAEGGDAVGGFAGVMEEIDIDDIYSTGLVSGEGTSVGGLIGHHEGPGAVTASFWDIETSGQASSAEGEGHTTEWMKTIGNFLAAGWDVTATWGMVVTCEDGYACLLGVTPGCALAPPPPPVPPPKEEEVEVPYSLLAPSLKVLLEEQLV